MADVLKNKLKSQWLDLRPTQNRMLVNQSDPIELDQALKQFAVSGINTILPVAAAHLGAPLSLSGMIPMLGHSVYQEYSKPRENVVMGDKLENIYNMNRDIQQGKPVDLYQRFKDIILGGMFSR